MFTPLARVDIEEAYAWYEAQQPGLGDDFRSALSVVWRLLDQFPLGGPEVHQELRRVLVPHFPYAVYYRVIGAAVEIRACLHQHQNPRVWSGRA
jgi:plasmid stabilization system protein ParE